MRAARFEAGDIVAERFVIEEVAGEGGAGVVFRARDREREGQVVALKVLHDVSPRGGELEREGRMLLQVAHPGVVRCVAFGVTAEGRPYLATEWLEGETLRARLKRGPLELEDALTIVRRVAEGLAAAHALGIVHRDVTPANVMLVGGEAAHAKLLDFGIATTTTAKSAAAGTPCYLSPEQARGGDVDARSDVFALGCVFYECLTGQRAFDGDHDIAVLAKILLDDPPAPSTLRRGVPKRVDAIVRRMLAKAPEARFEGGSQAAGIFAAFASSTTVEVPPDGRSGPALTKRETRAVSLLVAALPPDASREVVVQRLTELGGEIAPLRNRDVVVCVFAGDASSAVERSVRAAQGALAVCREAPLARAVVATARSANGQAAGLREVIDRATGSLSGVKQGVIVDASTARLLGERFAAEQRDGHTVLLGEASVGAGGTRTKMVGRDRECDAAWRLFEECEEESVARVVLLTGPPGIGKTRLRDALLERIDGERASVWIARGDPTRSASPLGVLGQLVRSAAGVDAETDPALVRARLSGACDLVPLVDRERVTSFLAELLRAPDDAPSVQLRAARADPQLMGDQIRRAWGELLAAELATRPVVLVIDDLQWSDPSSIAAIDGSLRAARELPLLVLGVGRPETKDVFPRLFTGWQPMHLVLGKLSTKATETLVRAHLGAGATEEQVKHVADRATGNPFFARELARAIADGREGELPSSVQGMIESRLAALETEARLVVRAASIYGQDFATAGVGALLGDAMKTDDVEQWASWLSERDVFDRRGPGRWSFRHALVRDAAYGMLTEEDRLLGHRLAGHWLALSGEKDAVVVATHFERSDDTEQAGRWLSRAAAQALEGSDFAGAIAFAERALAWVTEDRPRGELLVVQAEAYRWRGAYEDVRRCAQNAMSTLEPGAPKWFRAAAEAATALGVQNDAAGLDEVASALTQAPVEAEAESAASIAFARTALQLLMRGRLGPAGELLARAESFGSEEPLSQARILQTKAARADLRGEGHEHVRHTRACVAAFQRAGDERNACMQRSNLGYGLLELGKDEEASKELAAALASAQAMGLVSAEGGIMHLQAIAALRAGRIELALGLGDRAAEIFSAQGSARMEGGVRAVEAQARLAKGDLAGALASAQRAEALLRDLPPAHPYALAILAKVHLARRDVAAALPLAERAAQRLDVLGAIDTGEALVRLTLVEALDAAGDPRFAEALRAAKARLLERASRIDDDALRETFLRRVPDNARTLALAAERGA